MTATATECIVAAPPPLSNLRKPAQVVCEDDPLAEAAVAGSVGERGRFGR